MNTHFLKIKTMKTIKLFAIPLLALALFSSCEEDDFIPQIVNEEEVITKMTLTMTPVGGGTAVTLVTDDPDGDGPLAPVVTGGTFLANTTYNGSIELLDESDPTDVEDITEEVEEEDDEHQFFFSATGNVGTITYSDADGDGNPVGLSFQFVTGSATTGTLTVTLRHEPNKDAAGVSNGDITNAGGETDIEATFNVTVQ